MRTFWTPLIAVLCAAFLAGLLSSSCVSGNTGGADGGPDGGPAQACAPRDAPAATAGAPRRFLTPADVPLPAGRAFASSPVAAHAGGTTVAVFPVENGVGLGTGASAPFAGTQLLADRADTPALATIGSRFFIGYRSGGVLSVGVADDAQGVLALVSGRGRTLQIALPAGATTPGSLTLAASPADAPAPSVIAAFTALVPGGGTRVFAARLQNAGCLSCTLAFDAAVEASANIDGAGLPSVAVARSAGVAISFVRPAASGAGQLWVSQGPLGSAALSLRPLLVAEDAALEPAPVAFYSDGSLAVVHGRLASPSSADAGAGNPEVADVVARRLTIGQIGAAVRVSDDDAALGATHWLPGAAVDLYDRLWVSWYDTRFGLPGDAAWGPGPLEPARAGSCTAAVLLARSDDKGATFKPNALVTPDALTVAFDPVPQSFARARSPLGPVTVRASDTELLVGYSDNGRAALAEGLLP